MKYRIIDEIRDEVVEVRDTYESAKAMMDYMLENADEDEDIYMSLEVEENDGSKHVDYYVMKEAE